MLHVGCALGSLGTIWAVSVRARRLRPLLDRSSARVTVLEPGLVLIRGALPMAAQLRIAADIFEFGHAQRRFWSEEQQKGSGERKAPL